MGERFCYQSRKPTSIVKGVAAFSAETFGNTFQTQT